MMPQFELISQKIEAFRKMPKIDNFQVWKIYQPCFSKLTAREIIGLNDDKEISLILRFKLEDIREQLNLICSED
jgi:hypothetical protein